MKKAITTTALALILGTAEAQVAYTAPVGDLGLNAPVVTNVYFGGLADVTDIDVATGALARAVSATFMPQSNVYTKAQTDARIAELAPRTSLAPATNYTDSATNAIGETVGSLSEYVYGDILASLAGKAEGSTVMDILSGDQQVGWAANANYAMRADEASQIGNHDEAREAGQIFQQLDAAATKSALAAVSNEAQVVYRLFSGSNVVLEVTNYNSIANSPKLRLLQLTESNTYEVVWCETNNIEKALLTATNFAATASSAAFANATNASAPRAWSRTTSGMGVEAPAGTTWLSTPTTVIAGGYEPEKWITSGGAVWLITSKGATYDFSPSTNNTAYLNIAASDGTPMFRIEKTDSYLLPVHADAVSVDGSTLVVDFDLVSSAQPYARVCTDLTTHNWAKEEDGIPSSLSTVTWTQTSSGWRCRLSNNTGGNSLFGYFEYLQEGGTKIINEAVMDVSQGILCTDGVHKCRPVYNNGTITWQEVQQ